MWEQLATESDADKARLAELGPKNVGYEIQMDDIANWDKKI